MFTSRFPHISSILEKNKGNVFCLHKNGFLSKVVKSNNLIFEYSTSRKLNFCEHRFCGMVPKVSIYIFLCIFLSAFQKYFSEDISDEFMRNLTRQWIPMDVYESMNYFTLYEICQKFTLRRPDWCSVLFRNAESLEHHLNCSIDEPGISRDQQMLSVCPNLSGAFYRHHSTIFPYPKGNTIVDFIVLCLKNGIDTLYLVGDSMTRQHQSDLYCQLRRYGLHVDFIKKALYIRDFGKFLTDNSISFDSWLLFKDNKNNSFPTFSIKRVNYAHPQDHKSSWSTIQAELEGHRSASIVVLFNVGLHFNDPHNGEIDKMYSEFFSYALKTLIGKNRQFIMFRETSAQHWPTKYGLFEKWSFGYFPNAFDPMKDPVKRLFQLKNDSFNREDLKKLYPSYLFTTGTGCQPILTKEQYENQNWRNQIAFKILKEIDRTATKIPIIPFYDLTIARHDYHLKYSDCTHYCHGPMLWLPVIQEMYSQLEGLLQRQNEEFIT
jgi:hypothetical protein